MLTDMWDFDTGLAGFRPSIADYKYYVDFDKVFNNVEAIKIPLNILNSLIGSKNIENEFRNILEQYPETLWCIPILLAKRELDIMAMDEEGQIDFHFDKPNCTNEDYVKFMRKTGLFDLMENFWNWARLVVRRLTMCQNVLCIWRNFKSKLKYLKIMKFKLLMNLL